jgi:dipeptidase D
MHVKTKAILDTFEAINRIPRCSKNETQILRWLIQWAQRSEFDWKQDAAGNLVIAVPPTPGLEAAPGIVFQAHVDMVCEKTPDSPHDFKTDPIRHVVDGDWLRADQTTLGADNGLAVAMGMVLAEDEDAAHPSLELLFTVDEETGLNGAKLLASDLIDGKILLNVDSEEEGVFTVGCAGGKDTEITLALDSRPPSPGWPAFELSAGGMQGGHSGIDIDKKRANANQVLARALEWLANGAEISLLAFSGGTVHNAIPRDTAARFVCDPAQAGGLEERLRAFEEILKNEYQDLEPNLFLSLGAVAGGLGEMQCLSAQDTQRVINLLLALPHGVVDWSAHFENLVQTSANLAIVKLEDGHLKVHTSQRSSVMSRLNAVTRSIEGIAALAGADAVTDPGYPAWPPDMDSPLLARSKAVYRKLFSKDPLVVVLHAGLECAIIGDIYPGLDMISLGPTMENPHSPSERLYIPSVEKTWEFLTALLASYKGD